MLFTLIFLAGSVYAGDYDLIYNPNFTLINGTLIPDDNITQINDTIFPIPIYLNWTPVPINITLPNITINITPIPIPPEAVIRYNEEKQDFEVTGGMIIPVIDIGFSEECKLDKCLQEYTLTGYNNGTLSLELEHKKNKNKVSIEILSLSYNYGEMIYPDKNSFVTHRLQENSLMQSLSVKDKFFVSTSYNEDKEETKVNIKEEDGTKQKYTSENKIVTKLMTNRGNLEYGLMEFISF